MSSRIALVHDEGDLDHFDAQPGPAERTMPREHNFGERAKPKAREGVAGSTISRLAAGTLIVQGLSPTPVPEHLDHLEKVTKVIKIFKKINMIIYVSQGARD